MSEKAFPRVGLGVGEKIQMRYTPQIVNVDEEHISCSIISEEAKTETALPRFIYLHGGGAGTKEGVNFIIQPVLEMGYSILTLDFSGHGESTGELKKGSLKKRVTEATAAINKFAEQDSLTVCGISMGGFVAIKLLEKFKIDTLILFCPALYDGDAYDVRFDQGFTEIIRQPESWKNTDVLGLLNNFMGNLLLVIGEEDDVIPKGVIDLIDVNTQNARKKEIYKIQHCPHKIHKWILDNNDESAILNEKLQSML